MSRVPADVTLDDRGRFTVDLSRPPATSFQRVNADTVGILGRPCVWFDQSDVAWQFGYRIAVLPYIENGAPVVHVTTDHDWWKAALEGHARPAEQWKVNAARVWLIGYGEATPA